MVTKKALDLSGNNLEKTLGLERLLRIPVLVIDMKAFSLGLLLRTKRISSMSFFTLLLCLLEIVSKVYSSIVSPVTSPLSKAAVIGLRTGS